MPESSSRSTSDSGSELDFESNVETGSSRLKSLEGTHLRKLEEARNFDNVRAVVVGTLEDDEAKRDVAAALDILLDMKGAADFAADAIACSVLVLIL